MNDTEIIKNYLADNKIFNFVSSNLRQSLIDIGLSDKLVTDLIIAIKDFAFEEFKSKNKFELNDKFTIGFYKKIAGLYFQKEVLPNIKPSNQIIDIGCGTGTLANLLAESEKFQKVFAIDINRYPQWNENKNPIIIFKQLKEKEFSGFLSETKPDAVVMTWVLHHMELSEQERYLNYIYSILHSGSQLIILEDAYAETVKPIYREEINQSFMDWSKEDRHKIMALNDWIANKILGQRDDIPMPFGYRTLEEWAELFRKIGYKISLRKYLGFPKERDVNNPQSLIVAER